MAYKDVRVLCLATIAAVTSGAVLLLPSLHASQDSTTWQVEGKPTTVRVDIPEQVTSIGPYLALALSPDGRSVAFAATSEGRPRLWLYSLDSNRATPLRDTEGAERPFWSPDGQYIGFSSFGPRGVGAAAAGGKLKKVRATGGPASVLCNLPLGVSVIGSWNRDDVILLTTAMGPLLKVPADGGACTSATELDTSRNETSHRYPHFLPDGRHFLALAIANRDAQLPQNRSAFVGTLGSRERFPLPGITSEVMYSSGHVIFIRDDALMAQSFDDQRMVLTGDPFPLVERFSTLPFGGFSVSSHALAFKVRDLEESQLTWFDRNGNRLGVVGEPGEYRSPELSPDGTIVAFERGASPDIWLLDVATARARPFISNATGDHLPMWSPDGEMLAFDSNYPLRDLFVRGLRGSATDRLLFKSQKRKVLSDWSADGRYLVFTSDSDVWALPFRSNGAAAPLQVTRTPAAEANPRISPNSRWIAYQSDESGSFEVYVDSFPESGNKVRVSKGGGQVPRWSRDGKELFFLTSAELMVARFDEDSGHAKVGDVKPLFRMPELPRLSGADAAGHGRNYNISADGRVLVNAATDTSVGNTPITIVSNWVAAFSGK